MEVGLGWSREGGMWLGAVGSVSERGVIGKVFSTGNESWVGGYGGNWKTLRSMMGWIPDVWGGRDGSLSILAVQSVTAARP